MTDSIVTTWMAELAEAIRKGRLTYIRNDFGERNRNYKPKNIDTSAPVFHFGEAFDFTPNSLEFARAESLQMRARELVIERKFKLPYPKCFFVYTCSEVSLNDIRISEGRLFVNVVYAEQEPSGAVNLTCFSKITGPDVTVGALDRDVWLILPTKCLWFGPTLGHGMLEYEWFDDVRRVPDALKGLMINVRADLTAVQAGVAMLTERPTVQQRVQPSPHAVAVNAGRAKGRIAPLGDVIRVDLSPEPMAPIATGRTIASTPKRPHDRRGHWVTSKKGKKFWRRNMAIKGGRTKGAIYNVE